jgi:hypothetical protein
MTNSARTLISDLQIWQARFQACGESHSIAWFSRWKNIQLVIRVAMGAAALAAD